VTGFCTELEVRWDHQTRDWVLLADLVWVGLNGDVIRVPRGFHTDFASTPRIFQNLFPPTGAWTKAAVVHDWLCVGLNNYRRDMKDYRRNIREWERAVVALDSVHHLRPRPAMPDPPKFNAVDADNVFRLIMLEEGTPDFSAQFGWVGVRWGAAGNRARHAGVLSTLYEVLLFSIVYLFIALFAVALVAGLGVLAIGALT
jgi:hypothetical protein